MSTEQIPQFKRPVPIEPEGMVKNYKHALKEERIALKGGGLFDKALSVAFGWDPMPATRYNEAMRGVERETKKSRQYSTDNLDLLKAQAIKDMEVEGKYRYNDGSVPQKSKAFPENRRP